jgi:hypothetical protein
VAVHSARRWKRCSRVRVVRGMGRGPGSPCRGSREPRRWSCRGVAAQARRPPSASSGRGSRGGSGRGCNNATSAASSSSACLLVVAPSGMRPARRASSGCRPAKRPAHPHNAWSLSSEFGKVIRGARPLRSAADGVTERPHRALCSGTCALAPQAWTCWPALASELTRQTGSADASPPSGRRIDVSQPSVDAMMGTAGGSMSRSTPLDLSRGSPGGGRQGRCPRVLTDER